ncbi:unnamed protein product [Protopolystoma xenopodis]|uniref:Uncharacterized protein n=1 Tax=Protopolystoma xenopodis TaxID=117903 RepID=A0A3S5CUQ9_9PLAT|nr:unnamed protein product [Protopolystoma xenopodis]
MKDHVTYILVGLACLGLVILINLIALWACQRNRIRRLSVAAASNERSKKTRRPREIDSLRSRKHQTNRYSISQAEEITVIPGSACRRLARTYDDTADDISEASAGDYDDDENASGTLNRACMLRKEREDEDDEEEGEGDDKLERDKCESRTAIAAGWFLGGHRRGSSQKPVGMERRRECTRARTKSTTKLCASQRLVNGKTDLQLGSPVNAPTAPGSLIGRLGHLEYANFMATSIPSTVTGTASSSDLISGVFTSQFHYPVHHSQLPQQHHHQLPEQLTPSPIVASGSPTFYSALGHPVSPTGTTGSISLSTNGSLARPALADSLLACQPYSSLLNCQHLRIDSSSQALGTPCLGSSPTTSPSQATGSAKTVPMPPPYSALFDGSSTNALLGWQTGGLQNTLHSGHSNPLCHPGHPGYLHHAHHPHSTPPPHQAVGALTAGLSCSSVASAASGGSSGNKGNSGSGGACSLATPGTGGMCGSGLLVYTSGLTGARAGLSSFPFASQTMTGNARSTPPCQLPYPVPVVRDWRTTLHGDDTPLQQHQFSSGLGIRIASCSTGTSWMDQPSVSFAPMNSFAIQPILGDAGVVRSGVVGGVGYGSGLDSFGTTEGCNDEGAAIPGLEVPMSSSFAYLQQHHQHQKLLQELPHAVPTPTMQQTVWSSGLSSTRTTIPSCDISDHICRYQDKPSNNIDCVREINDIDSGTGISAMTNTRTVGALGVFGGDARGVFADVSDIGGGSGTPKGSSAVSELPCSFPGPRHPNLGRPFLLQLSTFKRSPTSGLGETVSGSSGSPTAGLPDGSALARTVSLAYPKAVGLHSPGMMQKQHLQLQPSGSSALLKSDLPVFAGGGALCDSPFDTELQPVLIGQPTIHTSLGHGMNTSPNVLHLDIAKTREPSLVLPAYPPVDLLSPGLDSLNLVTQRHKIHPACGPQQLEVSGPRSISQILVSDREGFASVDKDDRPNKKDLIDDIQVFSPFLSILQLL